MEQFPYLNIMKYLEVGGMARTTLTPQRLTEVKRVNIGRIIIFCEGKTEKRYFDYFASIINKNKYTDVEVVLETADGNAQTVLNFANAYLKREENNKAFSNYGKYLVFDCDDPPDIQAVIVKAKGYELLISNFLFETWLLMYYEEVKTKLSKRQTCERLSEYLRDSYKKGDKGQIREIMHKGDFEKAVNNARKLEELYGTDGKSIYSDISEMNPYTSVHTLVEQFMAEIS